MHPGGANSPAQNWYIRAGGQTTGPFAPSAVAAGINTGRYPVDATFSNGGPWLNAGQFMASQASPVSPVPPTLVSLPANPQMPPPLPPEPIRVMDAPLPPPLAEDSRPFPPMPEPRVSSMVSPYASVNPLDDPDAATEDGPPERDRIVVLGRRQSGKTIFLASIYAKLWKSMDGMTAKALSGESHKTLMTAHQQLMEGQWPPSTLGTSQIDLEIEYHGKKRLLVALDFAGELFSKAFVDEQTDWPGVKDLINHIDRAAAVMLLVDPSVVAGRDASAAMDDDFGLVQAVQRIRNWPGGDKVPIVLVLTKADQHQGLIDRDGGPLEFVRKHFRALLRVLKEVPIMQISAVQVETDSAGKLRPRKDSAPINVHNPLRYCLREIEKAERREETEQARSQRQMMRASALAERRHREERERRNVIWTLGAICTVGTALLFLILFFNV
jgi:hypothetical protein